LRHCDDIDAVLFPTSRHGRMHGMLEIGLANGALRRLRAGSNGFDRRQTVTGASAPISRLVRARVSRAREGRVKFRMRAQLSTHYDI
jgi:hypothetical protein